MTPLPVSSRKLLLGVSVSQRPVPYLSWTTDIWADPHHWDQVFSKIVMFHHISMPDFLAHMQATLSLVSSTYCLRSPRAIRLMWPLGSLELLCLLSWARASLAMLFSPLHWHLKLCFVISCLISRFWRNPNYSIIIYTIDELFRQIDRYKDLLLYL